MIVNFDHDALTCTATFFKEYSSISYLIGMSSKLKIRYHFKLINVFILNLVALYTTYAEYGWH